MLNAESYVRATSLIRAELQSDVARNVAILAGQPTDGCVIVMGASAPNSVNKRKSVRFIRANSLTIELSLFLVLIKTF